MKSIRIDCKKTLGKIKPMHAVGNGPLMGTTGGRFEYLKEAGIPYVRLHDTGGSYGGNVFVDIENIFRNFDADEKDPASYDFAFTDWLLKNLTDNGAMPFYRLGATIENAHRIKAYRIYPPKDSLKWTKICEGIIRHYTQGWADGFFYPIEYWEIWNEPDNEPNPADNPMWKGSKEEFFELYTVASKYLKDKFPHLKIGGYGSCGFYQIAEIVSNPNANISPRTEYFVQFFHEFLQYIRKENAPLDFFSWHSYASVKDNVIFSNYARKTLNEYGFEKTEHLCNEWNTGILLRGTLRDATNIAANMIALHKTDCSMAMYYQWALRSSAYCGAFNPLDNTPYKAYYAFKAFNELYRLGEEILVETDLENLYVLGAKNAKKACVLIANHTDADCLVRLHIPQEKVTGILAIDENRTYEKIADGEFTDGVLRLQKDAVVLVSFAI